MLRRFITEGIKNVTRSVWLSITAIMVLTVSLFSVTLIIGLSVTIGFTVRNLDTLVSFPAFFRENVVEEQIKNTIIPQLKTLPNVKNVEYFDKEKARKALDTGSAANFISQLKQDENLAWRYALITPDKSENYKTIVQSVKEGKYRDVFEDIPNSPDFIDNLIKFYSWTTFISIAMIVIFGLISVLVMSNILRMTIYNHRDEIEIMRLVGATNNYIRGPFVAQGVIYNIVSAGLVTLLFVSLVGFFAPPLKAFLGISSLSNGNGADLIAQIYLSLFLTMAASIGLGVFTVYVSIQKYLKY
jgi:cell division transport system permease protein